MESWLSNASDSRCLLQFYLIINDTLWAVVVVVVVVVVSSSIGHHFCTHVKHEEEAPFSCKLERTCVDTSSLATRESDSQVY